MSAQFFVKFEYQSKIKKVNVSEDQFKWDSICSLLSRTFSLEGDAIKLSYKDPEGDVITACCNDDLKEAYKTVAAKHTIKFFVEKYNKESESSQKSVYLRTKSLANPESTLKRNLELYKGQSEGQMSLTRQTVNSFSQETREVNKITIPFEEIQNILYKLFQTKEAKDEIAKLKTKLGLDDASEHNNFAKKFSFDIQQQRLSDCVTEAFKHLLTDSAAADKGSEHDRTSYQIEQMLQSQRQAVKLIQENTQKSISDIEENLLDVSIKESIYGENPHLNSPRESKAEDFLSKSVSGASSNFCKDLSSTHGVKLSLRFENGKMRLMSIPAHEYSIIESVEDSERSKQERSPCFRRSASVNLSAISNRNSLASEYQGPDSDLTRLLLID